MQALTYSVSQMRAHFEFLHGLGLTRKEAAAVLARCPTVLGLSVDANLWPKVEYLTKGLKGTAESLVSCPTYLTLSLQHRCAGDLSGIGCVVTAHISTLLQVSVPRQAPGIS